MIGAMGSGEGQPDGQGSRSRTNRFARRVDELSEPERRIAEGALHAAAATFATFKDDPQSHYYQAPSKSPEETWSAIATEVGRVTTIAAVEALGGGHLSGDDFDAIHDGVFRPVFGDETLHRRRYEEAVAYGIVLGPSSQEPEFRRQKGISGRSLPKRLEAIASSLTVAFDQRDEAVARGEVRRVIDATRPASRAYASFLSTHPYWDGNGRTAFPILTFALIRLGLLAVAVPDTDEFHWCLGRGMLRGGKTDFEALAQFLAELIHRSQEDR